MSDFLRYIGRRSQPSGDRRTLSERRRAARRNVAKTALRTTARRSSRYTDR